MLVSWNWLKQYVPLAAPHEAVAERLMMAGLNHEETWPVGDDFCIHLEVTSNRPDCLGHIGIAREASVLFELPLTISPAQPKESGPPVAELTSVRVENPAECPRYTARVIRGVKVAASPRWLVERLATIGIASINNIVDITNYVLMECGQPLHAFDLARLDGRRIVVRQARPGETLEAINHKSYTLDPSMCVIADERRAVGLGGVMGGADTEVTPATRDLLIESAEFDPQSIRSTARKLNLHSDSSYRFERTLDPEGVDWASRRCCELILEIAGGELAAGLIDVGRQPAPRSPVVLRYDQLRRVLGIDVEAAIARRILIALGNRLLRDDPLCAEVVPPSWRRDLTREIDLVEEVARIHGYDKIPEDVSVPMATSQRTRADSVQSRVRQVLTAAGYDEAMTLSAVEAGWSEAFSPWTTAPALATSMPVLKRADQLRRSLVPSLLGARQFNESLSNLRIELFEVSHVYLSQAGAALPDEASMVGLTSGGDFFAVKGVVELLLATLNPAATLTLRPTKQALLDPQRSAELYVARGGFEPALLGYLGELSREAIAQFELRGPATVAELKFQVLADIAQLIPQYQPLPEYPSVTRDLNLVVDEAVRWGDLAATVRKVAGSDLVSLDFQDTYRDANRLGPGKKSLLFTLLFRSREGTLTGDAADQLCQQVVAACQKSHAAQLRA